MRKIDFSWIESWYRGHDTGLEDRITGGAQLAKIVAGGEFKLTSYNSSTASVYLIEPPVINIPTWYFDKDTVKEKFEVDHPLASTALANGSLLHEAAHIMFTEGTAGSQGYSGFDRCRQLVEDIYIESRLRQCYPNMYPFVGLKNTILFPRRDLERLAESARQGAEYIELLDILTFWKREDIRDSDVYKLYPLNEATEILHRAKTAYRNEDREQLAHELAYLLGTATGKSRWEGCKQSTAVEAEAAIEFGSLPEERRKETEGKAARAIEQAEARIQGQDEVDLDELEMLSYEVSWQECNQLPPASLPVVEADYSGLADWLSIHTEVNRPIGEPTHRGPRLVSTRLWRVATDGKIFAYQSRSLPRREVDIILLADLSGSMHTNVVYNGRRWTLASIVLATAREVHRTLTSAPGMTCQVYGHSTSGWVVWPKQEVIIYEIARPNELDMGAFERAAGAPGNTNFDGVVIENVVERFTGRTTNRVLIVLSDGEPTGPYDNSLAGNLAYAREAVERARQQGIVVLALSVTPGVVDANNRIYGSEYNIRAYGDLAEQFKIAVQRGVDEILNR